MSQHELRGGITSEMDEHVTKQVKTGMYDSRSAYLRSLVRQDMKINGEYQ
jgi:Arc/MetJ-type ribon-helix-helix transcriptional regulator